MALQTYICRAFFSHLMKKTLLVFLIFSSQSWAQQLGDQSYLLEYKKAVQLYADNQYDAAASKFSQLCNKNYQNPIVPYAYFYNVLNQKGNKNNYQARVISKQLIEFFPFWEKLDDARMVYAELNFIDGFNEEALKQLSYIQDKKYDKTKKGLLNQYIPKIKYIATLKELYNKFPSEKVIALNLVEKIQANRYNTKEDLELSDMLTNRFKFKDKVAVDIPRKSTIVDSSIDFGLLLPFNISENKTELGSNKYIYDLYAGMKMAADELKAEKVNVKINAFDIKKNKLEMMKLEKNSTFKNLDVMVGPLYAEPNEILKKYVDINKSIQVHPISNNLDLLNNGANVFLAQSSLELQAKSALSLMATKGGKKTVSILYSGSKKDSTLAYTYKKMAESGNWTVNFIGNIESKTYNLSTEKGHVFYTGDEKNGSKILSFLGQKNPNCEFLSTGNTFNVEKLIKNIAHEKINLLFPEFIDYRKDKVKEFQKTYYQKMSAMPSYYGYLGYDMVIYFSKMLKDGKDIFKLNIEAGSYQDDYLLSGFDYSKKIKENTIVPILSYNGATFELAN